jgi:hypothetical protein
MTVKAKLSLHLITHHAIKPCVVVNVQLHTFLTSTRDGVFTFTLRPINGEEIEAGTDREGPKGGPNQNTVPLPQGNHYAD